MVVKTGGFRRKTRQIMRKTLRQKGKISLSKYFQEFKDGDVVCLQVEPAVKGGQYFPRYHGQKGIIAGMRGSNYIVNYKDGNIIKKLIVHPVHLVKVESKAKAPKAAKTSAKKKVN